MRISRILPILVLALWTAPGLLKAGTYVLELADVEKRVLENHPVLKAMRAAVSAEQSRASASGWPRDPEIFIGREGQSRVLDRSGASMERIGVTQKFSFPGKGWADSRIARHAARGASSRLDSMKWDALTEARIAYWDYWENSRIAQLRQESEADWKRINEVVKSRELSGQFVSPVLLKAQVEAAESANELLAARRNLEAVRARLDRILGNPAGTQYVEGGEAEPPAWKDLPASWKDAIRDNPRVAVARHEVARRGAARTSARLAMLPEFGITIEGMRAPGSGDFDSYAVMLEASMPLFLPFKQGRESTAASRDLESARFALEDEQAAVTADVAEAAARAEAAGRLWDLYRRGGLEVQTGRTWEAAKTAWRNEQISLADYVMAYTLSIETKAKAIRARAEYGRALAELSCALCIKDPLLEVAK